MLDKILNKVTMIISGKNSYKNYQGNNISINNGRVIIDGVDVTDDNDNKVLNITIQGNVESISGLVSTLKVTGDINNLSSGSGDVDIVGNVNGNIKVGSGDISVRGNVSGSVITQSGDIDIFN
jgi:hypothetical protein